VQAMVATGVGHALVPRLTVDAEDDMTSVIELTRVPPRLISIAWHRDRYRAPAAKAFAETAEAVCAELGTEPVAA
jgi:DNA-binding transcriptional LysR family regulator